MVKRLICTLAGHDWILANLTRSRRHNNCSWVVCCDRCGTWDEFGTPDQTEEFWDALIGDT